MWCILSTLMVLPLAVVASSTMSASAPNPTACGDIVRQQESIVFNSSQVLDCLISVPFNPAVASRLIKYFNDTVQFQSTLAHLANPPPGYQQPEVDLMAGLSQLQRGIDHGAFQNEYAFETALYRLVQSTHDDHLSLLGGIMAPFSFGSPYDIVSVSLDGKELPKVYITEDIFSNLTAENLPWQPSAIKTINGEDAVDFLTRFAAINSLGKSEPHADWNMLMRSAALDIQGYHEVFAGAAPFYPGDSIAFGFENGTTLGPLPWRAMYYSAGDTGPLETGGDFYNFFVLGFYPASYNPEDPETSSAPAPTSTTAASFSPSSSTTPTAWSPYPPPDVYLNNSYSDSVQGYFLHGSSVAVLSIPNFYYYGNAAQEFSDAVKRFITQSRQAGLQKVVIDLQQNWGGTPLLAIETFKLFFPNIEPFAGSNRRTHPLADALGSTMTNFWGNLTYQNATYARLSTNEWVATARLDATTGENFTSWEDLYGPAGFTKTERYNTSSSLFDQEASGIIVDGWEAPHQSYRAEDIIILTDGLCASACALFLEMMHHEASVRTVTVGGRPSNGPMQAASGSRGAASYRSVTMDNDIQQAQKIDESTWAVLPDRALDFSISSASVNLRDQVRRNDNATPLQFVYEPAECRIFYTPQTWFNYTQLWTYAADAIWRDSSLCVLGSTTRNGQQPQPPARPAADKSINVTQPNSQETEASTRINDHSNDILDSAIRIRSYEGESCNDGFVCPGGYICQEVQICDGEDRVFQKKCLVQCNGRCRDGRRCAYTVDQLPQPQEGAEDRYIFRQYWNRKAREFSLGFCQPHMEDNCNEDSSILSLLGINDD